MEHVEPGSFDFAVEFATRAHAGQLRKGSTTPYITHPARVAETLHVLYPRVPVLRISGVLHDVAEDTPVSIETIERIFGDEVGALVRAVTKHPGWHLDLTDRNVVRLKGADLLDNMTETNRDLDAGQAVWARFAAGIKKASSWTLLAGQIAGVLGNGGDVTTGDRTLAERVAHTSIRLAELTSLETHHFWVEDAQ